ncbi:MAG: hypothetical protein CM1200mP28_17080 [Deltaproteobacteria bacterium]|nr:MAG: hypothetical protein CM1200mP28_17080 [Deltaproteobacteria bacterium]
MQNEGISEDNAKRLAELRVFSSGPGAYGTGLLPLIDAGNWETRADLTKVFLKWGGHPYDSDGTSSEEINLLRERLSSVEIVHQNQDNREHDILDSDDYFQFQGGLQAAITEIRGNAPSAYHGDSSNPEKIRVRTLKEEFNRFSEAVYLIQNGSRQCVNMATKVHMKWLPQSIIYLATMQPATS